MVAKYKTSHLRQQKKLRFKKQRFCFLVIALFFGLVYLLLFSNIFVIKKIEVIGATRIPEAIIYNEVSLAVNNNTNWPFTNNLLFANIVLNRKRWNNDIGKVNINKNFFSGTLKVSIIEKQPIAKIIIKSTGAEILTTKERDTFFIDSEGFVFKSSLAPTKVLPEIIFTNSVNHIDKIIWDASQVLSFSKLLEYLYQEGAFNNDGLKFTYSLNRPNSIVYHFDEKYDIYLTLNKDIDEALKSAVGFANKNDDNKTTILNYIDARFYPEKLYYK